ncbi:MAG: 5'/3'-nucleotidase SurE [Candidatus Eutrophobiaceae bacterium]
MRVLLSNDDGYQSPGIGELADALSDLVDVVVVAPDRDCSGASHSLTLDRPLRVGQDHRGFHYVNGTPTDCVHLALTGLLEKEPDMVIGGINSSANLGDDVVYSGTVAVAMEGRLLGFPSLALSLAVNGHGQASRYDNAIKAVLPLLETFLSNMPLDPMVLNLNIPDLPPSKIKGYEITRLGQRHRAEPIQIMQDPKGHSVYWIGPAGAEQDAGPGTDFNAIRAGRISVTPLQFDLTAYNGIDALHDLLKP